MHQTIPDPEIEAVVPFKFTVVHVVMYGSVEDAEEKGLPEAAGHDLVA